MEAEPSGEGAIRGHLEDRLEDRGLRAHPARRQPSEAAAWVAALCMVFFQLHVGSLQCARGRANARAMLSGANCMDRT